MKISSGLFVSILALFFALCNAQMQNSTFHIGVILDFDSLVGRIGQTSLSLSLSDFYSYNSNYSTRLVLHVRDAHGQVIDAADAALSLLKDEEVDAIIGPQKSSQTSFVIGLGERANVPIISFSATSPSVNPQTPYFVQAALDDAAQVGAIAALVEYFSWREVVLVYEESDYGTGIIPHLSNAFQEVKARFTYRIAIPKAATDDVMLKELYKMKTMQTRVFLVHLSSATAPRFFLNAKEAGMMTEGYAWLVTGGLMDLLYSLDSKVLETMDGVLGVKPLIENSAKLKSTAKMWKRKYINDHPDFPPAELSLYGLWAYDTLWALAMSAEKVHFREPGSLDNTTVLNSSLFATKISRTGPKLLEAIHDITFQGLGGKFHLFNGHLEQTSFQILNVVGKGEREVGIWTPSHGILIEVNANVSTPSSKKLKSVVFPGDSTRVPKGWEFPVSGKKLRIGVPMGAGFPEFVTVDKDPKTNASIIKGGYIAMFDAVMAAMPYAVPYEYIPFESPDGEMAGNYDEFTYQVFLKNFDGAVGDITITSNRSKYVDFTLPFTGGGVTMIVPATRDNANDDWTFLKPLSKELWLTALGLFVLTGVSLWILEHKYNSAFRKGNHASMIFYFPFMSLVFAQRENIMTTLARIVVVVWMFVILILNSTYTASLSARLTVQRLQPVVTEVKELIRNGDYVGCHKGAFICDLLQEIGFEKSKINGYKLPEDIDEALTKGSKNGGISAVFTAKAYTDLFINKYCEKYMTVGPTYPTEGFAYVFEKGSPLVADVSRTVVQLTESGMLRDIEGQWIIYKKCSGLDSPGSNTVTVEAFRILFIITGGTTLLCVLYFLVKFLYENWGIIADARRGGTFWSRFCEEFHRQEGDGGNAAPDGPENGGNAAPDGPENGGNAAPDRPENGGNAAPDRPENGGNAAPDETENQLRENDVNNGRVEEVEMAAPPNPAEHNRAEGEIPLLNS